MKKIIIIFLFLGVLCMLNAQNFNLTGAGARAAGMGGAFIGVADDATAIVWNPAGLSLLERPELSIVGRAIGESWKYEFRDDSTEFDQSHFVLNFLSIAFPFNFGERKITGALALQKQLDMYDLDEWTEPDGVEYTKESTGGGNTFTFGFGSQIIPPLSLGFCGNLWMGKWEIKEEGDNGYENDAESEFSGFNFGSGVMLDLNNLDTPIPLKFGVTFKSPFDLIIDWKEGREVTVQMPSMIGFGGSYRIGEFFTFALDYEIRAYKDQEITYDDGSAPVTLSNYNLNQLRTGAEYLFVSDFAVIPVRVGFYTEPTTQNLPEDNGSVGDQIIGNGIAFGSGLIFDKFSFDLSLSASGYEIDWGNEEKDTVTKVVFGLSGIIYFN